jgi:NADH-quinone oxidoreductase subunit G
VALVSTWGSNEELRAFRNSLAECFTCFAKPDHLPQEGEVVEDDLLIRADKNPNTRAAQDLFGTRPSRFPTIPTWSWSGARASTSGPCRAA